jgi:TolB-like protein
VQPQEVRESLARMLSSRQFASAERRRKLLEYLVDEALAGRGGDLKEYKIGVDVYGRDASTYDPRVDPVIRVDIGRLRTKLAEYYAGEGRNDAVRIELPKGSYSVLFQPAPAVEIPAEHFLGAEIPATAPALAPHSRGWRPIAITLGVSLAIAAAAIGLWVRNRYSSRSVDTLAIIPFANLTADPSNDYFSDGLTDDLTAALGRNQRLRVISRASTFQFKNKNATPREIGRELGVRAILQGSVQRSGDQLRVIAQLNSASDGSQIWSDVFDGNGMNALRLEDGIAHAVAARLGDSAAPAFPKRDPEVHDLYLRGRFLQVQQTPAALLQSVEIYRQALARDPRDPECNAALASAEIYLTNLGQIPPEEADRVARPLIQKSLEADPSSGETHLMLGGLLYLNDHDWPAAEAELKKAVELGPNSPSIRNNYGYFLMYRGRFDEAAVQFAKGKEIDPLNVMPHFNMGSLYALRRDYPRAEMEFHKVIETSPKNLAARVGLADVMTFEKQVRCRVSGAGSSPGPDGHAGHGDGDPRHFPRETRKARGSARYSGEIAGGGRSLLSAGHRLHGAGGSG